MRRPTGGPKNDIHDAMYDVASGMCSCAMREAVSHGWIK